MGLLSKWRKSGIKSLNLHHHSTLRCSVMPRVAYSTFSWHVFLFMRNIAMLIMILHTVIHNFTKQYNYHIIILISCHCVQSLYNKTANILVQEF